MVDLLALALAIAAVLAQPTPPPAAFTAAMLADGTTLRTEGFLGRDWPCGDEYCYAGLAHDVGTLELVTGP